jgi:hypothetical protein
MSGHSSQTRPGGTCERVKWAAERDGQPSVCSLVDQQARDQHGGQRSGNPRSHEERSHEAFHELALIIVPRSVLLYVEVLAPAILLGRVGHCLARPSWPRILSQLIVARIGEKAQRP